MPTALDTGNWLVVAILAISGLSSLGGLVAFFATRREVDQLATRVAATEAALTGIKDELKDDKVELLAAGESRASKLHLRINSIETEIRDLPAQIITTLKNTGAI